MGEQSNLVAHAEQELRLAGLFDSDADYAGDVAKSVMELMETFAKQRPSGGQAVLVLELFNTLARFQVIRPLSNDPREWMDVSQYFGGEPMWQNKRQPSVFSTDGGTTWYDLEEGPPARKGRPRGSRNKPKENDSEQAPPTEAE